MMSKLGYVVIFLLSTGCIPNNPIVKNASISITAGSATYSLNEYCTQFSEADRRLLRQQVNSMSVHKAVITCMGDKTQ